MAAVALLNSLERAVHLTKCLPSATTQDQVSEVYSSLRDAQLNIQNFLLLNQQEEEVVATMDENNGDCSREQEMQEDDQPMPAMEDDELQKLQESIQYCALQSKRRKRGHTPSSVDGSSGNPMDLHYVRGQVQGQGQELQSPVFKPLDNQHKFDLIFQFHGWRRFLTVAIESQLSRFL